MQGQTTPASHIISACRRYIRIDRDAKGAPSHSTRWLAVACVVEGSSGHVLAWHDAEDATKSFALALAVKAAVDGLRDTWMKETDRAMVSVLPHDRIHYRTEGRCPCSLCTLIKQGELGAQVGVGPGTPDLLSDWESAEQYAVTLTREREVIERRHRCGDVHVSVAQYEDPETGQTTYRLPDTLPDLVEIYTDASVSTAASAPSRAGVAGVDMQGRFFVDVIDARRTGAPPITYAELASIDTALRAWAGRAKTIRIKTDSSRALELIDHYLRGDRLNSTDRTSALTRSVGEKIDTYAALGGNIEFEWVRGHDGDPGNELADQLAVLVRRSLVRSGRSWSGALSPDSVLDRCHRVVREGTCAAPDPMESVTLVRHLAATDIPGEHACEGYIPSTQTA